MKPIPFYSSTHTKEVFTICTAVHILMKPIPFTGFSTHTNEAYTILQQYTY